MLGNFLDYQAKILTTVGLMYKSYGIEGTYTLKNQTTV